MSLDPNQRRAVVASGSVAVVAGAGTGKTHMLARRYLQHLISDGLRPLNVVAVTFTRRAADELRARIRSVIAAQRAAAPDSLHPDALLEVEAAPIGTIHALAQRICHAFPEEAGLPPDVAVLDELDGRLWTAEALDAALDALDADTLRVVPFSLLRQALRTLLADPFRAEVALAKGAEELRAELASARAAALDALQGTAWHDAAALLRVARGPDEHPVERSRASALAALEALARDDSDAGAGWQVLCALTPHLGRAADWRDTSGAGLSSVKAALRTLRDGARSVWDDGRGPAAWTWGEHDATLLERTAAIRDAFARVRSALAEQKRRAKQVDFGDLEVHAVRALERPSVRAALQRRWRALLVDEYQDTSPAQARLLELLRGAAPVTVVGDEKQSIYAFRGADVRVFRGERERLAARPNATSVELRTSYRSHRALVDTVNRVFDAVLGVDAAPLEAAREQSSLPGPHVRWLELDAAGSDSEAAALAEAERVARAIAALLRSDPPLLVESAGERRPLRAGDIAVLARSRSSLEPLEGVAPGLGVPVLNAGGGDVLATREGLDALALLRAVTDPSHAPALLTVLRGPFVAASDRAIHAFAAAATRGKAGWWQRLDRAQEPHLRAGAALLAELRALHARGADAAGLLRAADAARGYRAVLANLPNAPRRLADWDGMLALVTQLEAGAADPAGLVRRLERLRAAQVAVPRPPLRSSDAVALMSIHAAKGLEWPVVIVLDLARRTRVGSDEILVDPDLGVTLRWRDAERAWCEPALYQLAERRRAEREAAEDARLAYVALTRARDVLLLSTRGGSAGLRARLAPGLSAAGLAPETEPVPASAERRLAPVPSPPAVAAEPDPALWQRRFDDHPAATPSLATLPLPSPDPFAASPLFANAGESAAGHEPSAASLARGWAEVAAALAILDEEGVWQPLIAAVAAARLPAPASRDVFARMRHPDGSEAEVPLRWPGTECREGVALVTLEAVAASAPLELVSDGWRWLAVEPSDVDAALGALRRALGVAQGG